MMHAIHDRNLCEIEGAHTIEACDIYPVLRWIGAPLVMRVYSADGTKEMLRLAGVEPVAAQLVLARDESYSAHGRGNRDRAAHPAIGTCASADGVESVAEFDFKPYRSTMTLAALHPSRLPQIAGKTITPNARENRKLEFASPDGLQIAAAGGAPGVQKLDIALPEISPAARASLAFISIATRLK